MNLLFLQAVVVHDNHLTEHDAALIAERGASVVHCPSINTG